MCLTLCWAYTDFGQSCSLLSWNLSLMDYCYGQSQQAWPQIPSTQGVRCRSTGLGAQRREKPGQRLDLETQKCAWPKDKDHCSSFIYTLCCKWEAQALGLYTSPFQWRNSLETHYKFIIGDLESGCGHLETFKVDKLIQPIYIENLWVSLAKKVRHQKKGLLSFEGNEKPGVEECWFWCVPGYKS